MSPHAARLFFGCSISFLLGGAAGVFGLRTLYGDVDRVDPEPPRRLECPPPPPCPACPEPVDCGEIGRLPAEDDGAGGFEELSPGSGGEDEPDAPSLPGLPPSVLPLAHEAVKAEVAGCLEQLIDPVPGVALLQLTVLTESGRGYIRDALVTRATGDASEISGCLADSARRAEFEWSGTEGQLSFRLPVTVGQR